MHALNPENVFYRFRSECLNVRTLWLQSGPTVMAETIINDIVLHAAELLHSLEKAGAVGSPKAQLVGGKGRKGKEEALATLIARREVLNVGNPKKPRFALARLCDPLDLARIAIEEKAVARCAMLFSRQELAEGCSPAAEEELDAALDELVREKRLIRAERGKTSVLSSYGGARATDQPRCKLQIRNEPHHICVDRRSNPAGLSRNRVGHRIFRRHDLGAAATCRACRWMRSGTGFSRKAVPVVYCRRAATGRLPTRIRAPLPSISQENRICAFASSHETLGVAVQPV